MIELVYDIIIIIFFALRSVLRLEHVVWFVVVLQPLLAFYNTRGPIGCLVKN